MSQKFTFIIEVNKKGEPVGHAYKRVDAQKAISDFYALRDNGIEACLFQFPVADKKSKSAEQLTATASATAQPTEEERIAIEAAAKKAAKEAYETAERVAQEQAVAKTKSRNKITGV